MSERESHHVAATHREDPDADTYTASFDPDAGGSASRSVVEAVAAVSGTEPERLPPLFETVDAAALDRLFDSPSGRPGPSPEACVSFRYRDHDVTVYADGGAVGAQSHDDSADADGSTEETGGRDHPG